MISLKTIKYFVYINPNIFRRFFFRKQPNNKVERLLPVVFIIIIAFSTSTIVLSSLEIYQYRIKINDFIQNEWNKIYFLYLGDQNSNDKEGVFAFLDSLRKKNLLKYNIGFLNYPQMAQLRSKDVVINKILAYSFDKDFDYVIRMLGDSLIAEKPVIFLNSQIMEKMNIDENDIVYIKGFHAGPYFQALKARRINNDTRVKCFFLQDFLGLQSKCEIRFYFKKPQNAIDFTIRQLLTRDNIPTPIYFGYKDFKFGGIIENLSQPPPDDDIILSPSYISSISSSKDNPVIFNDYFRLVFKYNNGEEATAQYNISNMRKVYIEKAELDSYIYKYEDTDFTIGKVDLLNCDVNNPNFFIGIDFQNNFSIKRIRNIQNAITRQLKIFNYIDECDSIAIVSYNKRQKRYDLNIFMYYTELDNIALSKDILRKLNYLNVRWDSGRWNTIIFLNESLKRGEKNTILLSIVNLIIFLFFLNIKFLLRLKLDFHSIGVIKCFGYSNFEIYKVYLIGYLLLVILGFIIGIIPLSYFIGLMRGYDLQFINHAIEYYLLHPLNFIYGFGLILVLSSIIAVGINLNRLVRKANIYELIKYEA